MIQQKIENQCQVNNKMDISFWVDINRQKIYIKTKVSKEDIKNETDFEKLVANIMENNNGLYFFLIILNITIVKFI